MERKSWRLWIVAVIAMMLICFTAGAIAEEYPTNPYLEEVWKIDQITRNIGKRGDNGGYWLNTQWIVFEEIQAPSLTQHGRWRITLNNKPVTLGAVTRRNFYIQSVDQNGDYSTEYMVREAESDTFESCDFVAPGNYRLVADYDFENQSDDTGYENHIYFTITRSEDQSAQDYPTVTEKAAAIVQQCQVDGDKWQTALNLHDWLTRNAHYDGTYSFYGAEGVLLRGSGVCDSYAKAYLLLCQKAGIPARRVTGKATNSSGKPESHAWNAIQLDGEWYLVDATWDDPVIPGKETVTITGSEKHEFFCLNDELMGLDHANDGKEFSNGQCNSLAANYLLKTGATAWDSFGDGYIKDNIIFHYSDNIRDQIASNTTFTINCEQSYYDIRATGDSYSYSSVANTSVRAKRCWTLLAMSMSQTPFTLASNEQVYVTVEYNRDDKCFTCVKRDGFLSIENMNKTALETGETCSFLANYITNNATGITLTVQVFENDKEAAIISKDSNTNQGEFEFQIWEEGSYRLVISAERAEEVLASEEIPFTVSAIYGYHNSDPQIPRYWQIPLSGAPYQLTLNYGEDALKPDKVDVYVYDDETGEAVINETGIDPDTVLECPIKKGDCFNVRVTNYKQGYRVSTYNMYNCKAVFGTLGAPTAIVPTSAAAGEPINITIDEVTNTDYYRAEITGTTVNYYANRRINQAGAYTIEEFGLDSGEYKILLTAEAYFDYAASPATEYTLTVAGERPPVPTVTEPEGPFAAGSIAWYTLTGEGLTAVCRNYSGDVYQAQNGTAMVPVEAYGWKRNFSFRGLYNGRWSHATDEFELTGQAETKPEVEGPTLTLNPETPLRGQNLRVGVTPVEGATHYAFSFGLHLTYDEDEIHEDFMDQIIYDEPFEISDGGVTIQGCNLIQAGEYSVTVTAYSDLYGGTLCETTRHFTVGENPNIPAAPNVTLLTTENLLFGTSRFRIDIPDGGADRVYAFISRQDDYGLEENPIEKAIDPNATSDTFEWQSLKVGTYEAYFAISRNGTWSDSPEPLVFDVKTTSEEDLCEGKKLNYPAEAEIGDTVTISWDAISEAEWFEAYAEVNDDTLYDGKPAKGATSIDIDTTNAKNSGNLDFELWAYAPGYYRSSIYTDPEIMLLDPRLKITAMLTQALDSANIVTLHLTNVQANRIRVKIDGEVVGMYGLGPNDGTADLTIMVPRRDSQIQVANYDTDPRKWGTWSDPVTANSVIVDPTKILYLPEDLTRIEANAFEGIDAEAIVVPAGCEYIGDRAFANCPNLVYVSYPESATLAGDPFVGSNVKTYNVYEVQQD